jgi:hypothetical protein
MIVNKQDPTQTSQTGNTGTPIQVENIQYNVNVKKVTSKIGLSVFLSAILLWFIAFIAVTLFTVLRAKLFPDCTSGVCEEVTDFGEMIVFSISGLIPLVPIFIFLIYRTKKILVDNPAASDDIFFKRTVRFHLVISLLAALGWAFVAVYNLLGKIFLQYQDITGAMIMDSFIFAAIFIAMTWFFWMYERMTRR